MHVQAIHEETRLREQARIHHIDRTTRGLEQQSMHEIAVLTERLAQSQQENMQLRSAALNAVEETNRVAQGVALREFARGQQLGLEEGRAAERRVSDLSRRIGSDSGESRGTADRIWRE